MTWGRSLLATTSLLWDKLPHDCSSIPWMDDKTPTPNRKKKKILPFPLSPKPKKGKNWLHWLHTEPSSVPCFKFLLWANTHITGSIPIVLYRAKWAIPWNSGVLQFKKGPRPPPLLFALYVHSAGQTGLQKAQWASQTGHGTSPSPLRPITDRRTSELIYRIRLDSEVLEASDWSSSHCSHNP